MASMISHRGSHPSDSFAQLLAVSNTRRNEQQALKAEAVFLSSLETNAKTSQPPSKPKKRARKYSRKEKSLGMLCGRFLHLYEGKAGVSICLDEAAQTLGVERRRIYDIVNILESVEIVSRRGKNQYEWHGRGRLGESLKQIKEEVDASFPLKQKHGCIGSSKRDSRREKSLGLLSRRFVQMFFSSDSRVVSLDEAGSALVDDRPQTNKKPGAYKSKVRRLYDIANVLSSLRLIRKVYLVEPRKAAFMWLGAGVFPLNSNIQDDTYVASQETLVPSGSSKSNSSSDEKIRRMDDASSTTQSSTDRVFQPRRIKSFLQLSPSEEKGSRHYLGSPRVREFSFSRQHTRPLAKKISACSPVDTPYSPFSFGAFGMSTRSFQTFKSTGCKTAFGQRKRLRIDCGAAWVTPETNSTAGGGAPN